MKGVIIFCLLGTLFSCSTGQKKKAVTKKAELYYGHGTDNLISKNYSKALELLLKANELDPNNSKILNNLAMAYYLKKQSQTAINLLKKSIDINPKNSDARNNLAGIYYDTKNYESAKKQYLLVEKDLIYPHQYRTYYNLSLIEERNRNFPKMLHYLNKSKNERDDYCPTHIKLGKYYLQNQNYAQAIKSFKSGSKGTCYKHPNSTYYLAQTWEKLSENQKAIDKYIEVVSTFPKTSFAKLAQKRIDILVKDDPMLDLRLKKHNTSSEEVLDAAKF